jgi:predicted TIM-barrel fold metal-dependent hydrolase
MEKREMVRASEERIEKYVEVTRKVHNSCTTYDVHIHPFEIFFNPPGYKEDPDLKGLFSLGNVRYSKPTLESLKNSLAKEEGNLSNMHDSRFLQFFLRRTYFHTGPFVFGSLFELAGIDKGLLLPVARGSSSFEEQMDLVFQMYSDDKRFCLAGSVPNSIRNEDIKSFLKTLIDKYTIVAVKAHPNLTGIDLRESAGKERIEWILDACSSLNLPVIMHAGRSNHLSGEAGRFAEIENFKNINLRASIPIVMAHGGAYGVSSSEIREKVIPELRELLETNENLCIDISGLQYEAICQLLGNVETERILFGSDALYHDPFVMEMRLLAALDGVNLNIEESYTKIVSKNIERRSFRWK